VIDHELCQASTIDQNHGIRNLFPECERFPRKGGRSDKHSAFCAPARERAEERLDLGAPHGPLPALGLYEHLVEAELV